MTRRLLLLLIAALIGWTSSRADDIPYRQQMREIYRQLPVQSDDIVFLGNSITDFGLWSEFFGGDTRIINRGIQGIESPEVLEHIAIIGEGHPRKLFLMIGINDFKTPERVVPNIRRIITLMQQRSPETELYIQSILPCNLAPRATTPTTLNPQIKSLCAEMGVTYLDIFTPMANGTTSMPAAMTCDQLHPNILGYRLWCNTIKDAVGRDVAIDATANTFKTPLTRQNMFKSILSAYQLLPVSDDDILHVGDYQVMTGEWEELMGMPNFKNRGCGGGYGWCLTLDEFNAGYDCFIKGSPKAIFFQCGKRDLDPNTASVATVFSKYKTAVQRILEQAPDAQVYLESIIPNADAAVNTKSIAPFNALLREYVESSGNARLHFVDVYSALAEGDVLSPRYVGANTDQSKGINGRGYVRWANVLAQYVPEAHPVAEMSDARHALNEALWSALDIIWAHTDDAASDAVANLERLVTEGKAMLADVTATDADLQRITTDIEQAARVFKFEALGVLPGHGYTITNLQSDGTARALYVSNGQLQIGAAGKDATAYGDKAVFFAEDHGEQLSFQNAASAQYLIFRGNGNGYNNDKGVIADCTEPYALWTLIRSASVPGAHFFYSMRKDGKTAGSLVIMKDTGKFDAYSSVEGYTDRFSNVFRFTEVPTDPVGIRPLDVTPQPSVLGAHDLLGRASSDATRLYIHNGHKYLRAGQ